ncbi:MAG: type II toxin-antitoxin system VapC family toxin [Hydrococcus sp. SU_1_0]|nr:type II toxin-antitoxin system VapC family toxin [Hydrococcus sp. SU_1_0]
MIARKALFIVEADSDYTEATALALEVKHPIYDCLYLAFARHFRVPLVTADKRLEAISQEFGVECFAWR